MQLRQAAVILLTSTVVLTQLSGCAAVAPDKGVENSDDVTVVIAGDKDTVDINGNEYDISGAASNSTVEESSEPQIVEMPQDMLHDLFKEQYEAARTAERLDKNYGTDAYDFYKKLSAQDIGTQEDANVYNQVKIKVYGYVNGSGGIGRDSYSLSGDGFGTDAKYYSKYNLPTDGFAQYVSWRQQYESSLNQSTSNSSTANSSYVPDDAEYIPDGSSGMSTNIEDYVDPSLIEGDGTGSTATGVDPDDYNESIKGGAIKDKELPEPEYEIIG